MHFAQPVFLPIALAMGLLLTGLLAYQAFARRRALGRLGSPPLLRALTGSVSKPRRRAKEIMLVAGVFLVCVALARPQVGFRWEAAHRRGVDILFAVDTSKSMLTPDVKPNRLERAKLAVHDLVTKFPSDRVGLVAFAGSAFLETPLTLDHAIFEQSLETLDTNVIPLGGTNVASAIGVADKALADDTHKRVLVLLTDGEDLAGDALAAAESAGKRGLVVYTVGVGTPSGELIPLHAKGAPATFVKDEAGRFVTSKLDETRLRRLSAATGGTYRALGDNGRGLELLYQEDLATLPRSDLAARDRRVPIERFQWPLGLGIFLLAVEPLLGERRRRRVVVAGEKAPRPPRRGFRPHAPAVAAAAALALLLPTIAHASPQSAERAYRSGEYKAAAGEYADAAKAKPDDARLTFNLGDSAYRSGDLSAATKSFEGALHTGDLTLQERAYYNLGDALYRSGEATLKAGKTDDTIRTWKQAVADYEAALHLDGADADATFNRDFVNRRLAELQKKNEEQKKGDQKKQDQKKQDQKNQPPKSGSGEKQSKSGGKDGSQPKSAGKDGNQGAPNASKGDQPGQAPSPQASEPPKGQGQSPGAKGESQPATPADARGTDGKDAREDEAPSAPGELSKKEARALLDSLRGDLQIHADGPLTHRKASEPPPQKDW